jgi:phytoene dehydrogenase-like protein
MGSRDPVSGLTRRDFLLLSGGALLLGCTPAAPRAVPGRLLGPDAGLGHRLRDGGFPAPVRELRVPVLIAGAGIAGLSCAWWLRRHGFGDFLLLELDREPGGNARGGRNDVSAFPWGAHYLPLPGPDAVYTRQMLAEFGVLRGDPRAPAPEYDPALLVHAPDERLFIHGRWQDGLLPQFGVGASALRELERFQALMQAWSARRGRDGRPAFTVPSALSSRDPEFLALDHLTFHDWLLQQDLRGEALHWYVSYCCRDDYGADPRRLSAWAGLHYFCSRHGRAANADAHSVLTAPQGNAWFAERLAQSAAAQLRLRHAVVRITTAGTRVSADVYDAARDEVLRVHCDHLVWAAPLNVLARVWPGLPGLALPDYAPWVVVNLTARGIDEREFTTWDNVIYRGRGLGYIDATHQALQYRRPDRVLTWYHALSDRAPVAARRELLTAPHDHWTAQAFADLRQAHPTLEACCSSADVWRWPHAMAIPAPGFLAERAARAQSGHARIHLAHSDQSGFSLFEEAQFHGADTAARLLPTLRR